MNHRKTRGFAILTSFVVVSLTTCQAQNPVSLKVGSESLVRYPTLRPQTAISVYLADPVPVADLVEKAIGADPHHPLWDCTKPSSYRVAVLANESGGSPKPLRYETIMYVALQGNDDVTGKRLTFCEPRHPGMVQLIIDSNLSNTETVQVSLVGLPDGLTAQSDGKLAFTQTGFSLSVVPQAAPSEKLTNGMSRDVGQLSLSLADSSLFPKSSLPLDVYAKSKALFSTDEKDSQSSFSETVGIRRGIIPKWYTPVHFEETIQGNQSATNLSNVATLGFTTLLPWSWSGKVFRNPIFDAPLPPDATVNNQYIYRIKQDIAPTLKALATNDYSLNLSLSWASIRFPWACTLLDWIHIRSQNTSTQSNSSYCLGAELNGGTYYLPLDLTAAKTQRLEGYGDVSILLPLSSLTSFSKFFPFLGSGDPAKSQIRIKYADSVNPANNYARSKQWTYGIELMK